MLRIEIKLKHFSDGKRRQILSKLRNHVLQVLYFWDFKLKQIAIIDILDKFGCFLCVFVNPLLYLHQCSVGDFDLFLKI